MALTTVRVKDIGNDNQKYAGFYGNKRRKKGDIFQLDRPNHFSGTYMAYVSGPKPLIIIKREAEAKAEDEKIAYMRKRQAEGDSAPAEIILNADEIESPESVEVEVVETPVKKTTQPQNSAAKKKAAATTK